MRFKKEKVKLEYQRRERLNQLLMIHPRSRSPDDEMEIAELLVDSPCLQYVAEERFDGLIELSREIYMECILADQTVI